MLVLPQCVACEVNVSEHSKYQWENSGGVGKLIRQWQKFFAATMLLSLVSSGFAQDAKITPAALAALADTQHPAFLSVSETRDAEGLRRQVVAFEVDGLTQYALVLWPVGDAPVKGWPALQFNHGFHPDPPRNGFNAQGETDRDEIRD